MKLFHPEHGNALRTFYPDDSENHSQLLEGLATMLEANVLQNSASYDLKKKGISDARKQLFESGVSRMLFPVSLRGLELPFGVYSLAMEAHRFCGCPDRDERWYTQHGRRWHLSIWKR